MMTHNLPQPFTSLQLELLKLYATDIPEKQLLDIKNLLAVYFAKQVDKDMTALWEEKGWDDKTIEAWKHERLRIPYK